MSLRTQNQDERIKLPHGRYKASEIQTGLNLKGFEATVRRALSDLVEANKVNKIKHEFNEFY